jgi:hypothetical protein
MDLFPELFKCVVLGSFGGGALRWAYPNLSKEIELQKHKVNFKFTMLVSCIFGCALTGFFYAGLSGATVSYTFLIELGVVSFFLTFNNLDKLDKFKA